MTSTSYSFVAADVGSTINIISGTGWTAGKYLIVSVASNAATLDRSPAAVGVTGGTYQLGRGRVVMVQGAAGVADTLSVCRKDGSNVYAWTALY